jgi:hypothetical protein
MDTERAQRVYSDFRERILSTLRRGGANHLARVEAWEQAKATIAENGMTVCVYNVQSVHSRLVNQLPSDYIIDSWKAATAASNMAINGNGALQTAPMQTLTVALRWRFNYMEYFVNSAVHSLHSLVVGVLWLVALTVFVMLAWWVLHLLAARAAPSWFGSAADIPGPWTRVRTAIGALSWRSVVFAAAPPPNVANTRDGIATERETQQQPPPPPQKGVAATLIRHAKPPQSSSAPAARNRQPPPLHQHQHHHDAVGQESPPIGVMPPSANDGRARHAHDDTEA